MRSSEGSTLPCSAVLERAHLLQRACLHLAIDSGRPHRLYLALDLVSPTSCVLTAYLRHGRRSLEAALEYRIYGGVASGTTGVRGLRAEGARKEMRVTHELVADRQPRGLNNAAVDVALIIQAVHRAQSGCG
jgi:hypothetical protein